MSDNHSCILRYELKQQTPMIHFQHDEPGACIRAAELKPKLDKFLIEKHGKDKLNSFFIRDGIEALNYKVKIYPTKGDVPDKSQTIERDIEISEIEKPKGNASAKEKKQYKNKIDKIREKHCSINGMYFGNMVDKKENDYEEKVKEVYKETVFYKKPIVVEIICMFSSLRKMIDESFEEFLIVTNFGTRQNKGFGGFWLKDNEGVQNPMEILKEGDYPFFYCDIGNVDKEKKLDIAQTVYAVMKGGINRTGYNKDTKKYKKPEAYIKGFIQRDYLDSLKGEEKIGSDKVFIKSKIILKREDALEHYNSTIKEYDHYYFVRALLGLADHYEFRDDMRKGNVKIYHFFGTKLNENRIEFNDKNLEENEGIQRFKSPVTISIIESRMFFIFDDTFERIKGEVFFFISDIYTKENRDKNVKEFSKRKLDEKKRILEEKSKTYPICVPSNFDVNDFIACFVEYYNSSETQKRLRSIAEVDEMYKSVEEITLKLGENNG